MELSRARSQQQKDFRERWEREREQNLAFRDTFEGELTYERIYNFVNSNVASFEGIASGDILSDRHASFKDSRCPRKVDNSHILSQEMNVVLFKALKAVWAGDQEYLNQVLPYKEVL